MTEESKHQQDFDRVGEAMTELLTHFLEQGVETTVIATVAGAHLRTLFQSAVTRNDQRQSDVHLDSFVNGWYAFDECFPDHLPLDIAIGPPLNRTNH